MSAEPRRDSKWWGWGDPAVAPELDAEAKGMLQEWVGELEPWPLASEIDGFEIHTRDRIAQVSRPGKRSWATKGSRVGCAVVTERW